MAVGQGDLRVRTRARRVMSDDRSKDGGPIGNSAKLPMYLGPYEAWNFGPGRGYGLPMFRRYWRYISALAELGSDMSTGEAINAIEQQGGWIPTFWQKGAGLTFIPFVVSNPFLDMPTVDQLQDLLRAGFERAIGLFYGIQFDAAARPEESTSGSGQALLFRITTSRFRVAFPVADGAMHADAGPSPTPPGWQADPELSQRIGAGKKITIVAVIDDGLPFAHRNFR